jgi:hypothetical protein
MLIKEVVQTEGVVQIWSRSGGKMVRKYRCTSGARKNRIVSKPSVCTQPKKASSVFALKKAKARRGSTIRVKTARTKRATQSRRIGALNKPTSMKRIKIAKPGRSAGYAKRKPIRK